MNDTAAKNMPDFNLEKGKLCATIYPPDEKARGENNNITIEWWYRCQINFRDKLKYTQKVNVTYLDYGREDFVLTNKLKV